MTEHCKSTKLHICMYESGGGGGGVRMCNQDRSIATMQVNTILKCVTVRTFDKWPQKKPASNPTDSINVNYNIYNN